MRRTGRADGFVSSSVTLEVGHLSAGYDRAPVVRDLTLSVSAGEVVALLGVNGAGKTTTLRAISGLIKPMAGAVRLDGADLAGVSPTARVRKGIVHVPHDRGIFYGLTVAEHFHLDGVTEPEGQQAAFALSLHCGNCTAAGPGCCRAASSRCSPFPAPSCASPGSCCSTSSAWASPR
jgi:ABC-type branched-subunit amino acid transport system ATPase component